MSAMKEVKAIVRPECVPDLLHALEAEDVTRFYVSKVHALGAATDPEDLRVSWDEEAAYTEKAKLEFLCRAERVQALVGIVQEWARTGQRGDGMVVVSHVTDVVNVRTGDHDRVAIL